jgi:hypothetical protein
MNLIKAVYRPHPPKKEVWAHLIYGSVDKAIRLRADSRQSQETFLSKASRRTPEPTEPPNQWAPRSLSPGIKRSGRETDGMPLGATVPIPEQQV